MSIQNLDVDLSELEGKMFTCYEECGLCCLCQAEVLPEEVPFFKKNYPKNIVQKTEPHRYTALALKNKEGPCIFLAPNRRCTIYNNRPHYCRQFPFHLYSGDRIQVELDLSCRGVWGKTGEDALVVGANMVSDHMDELREYLAQSKEVYREFENNCKEAGTYRTPDHLRKKVKEKIPQMMSLQYLAKILDMSCEDEEMELPEDVEGREYSKKDLEISTMETGMESLIAEDIYSAPVYCDPLNRWNVFMAEDNEIEWAIMGDDGVLTPAGKIDPQKIELLAPEGDGIQIFLEYLNTLNNRDSSMGYTYYLVDDYGYEDYLANAYYGMIATSALDVLWRASLIAHINGWKLDARGMTEGIIAYDMDRLDAPTIGAFL